MIVTKKWIYDYQSCNGGWTKSQLQALGIDWPPYKGWIQDVDGKQISAAKRKQFEDSWKGGPEGRKKNKRKKWSHEWICQLPGSVFYSTKAWWSLRARVLMKYGYKCMLCNSIDEIQVDHIQPRSRAPELSLTFSNLQVLCRDCNRQKSNIHAEDYREERVAELLDEDHMERLRDSGFF